MIGAVLIVAGLYTVVWGKSKDQTTSTTIPPPPLSNEKNDNLEFATNFDSSSQQSKTSKVSANSTLPPV